MFPDGGPLLDHQMTTKMKPSRPKPRRWGMEGLSPFLGAAPLPPISGPGGPLPPRPGQGLPPSKPAAPGLPAPGALGPQAPLSPQAPLGDRHLREGGAMPPQGPGPRHALDAVLDGLVLEADEALAEAHGLAGPLLGEAELWAQHPVAPPLGQAAFRKLGEAFGG